MKMRTRGPATGPTAEAPRPTSVVVRESVYEDMPALQAIYAHHVLNGLGSFEETAPGVEEMMRRRAALVARSLPYLVAELNGEIAGFAYAAPFRTRSAYRYTVEDSIYVGPRAMRRGVGQALLGALIVRCADLGYRQMIAIIGDSGNTASIALHERMGFVRAGLLHDIGWKFGGWVDIVIMQRTLDASDEA